MEQWQLEMINRITPTHPHYDNDEALSLAKEWNETDEKFSFILDTFVMSANDARVDYWVDRIEDKFEKILKANETGENNMNKSLVQQLVSNTAREQIEITANENYISIDGDGWTMTFVQRGTVTQVIIHANDEDIKINLKANQ